MIITLTHMRELKFCAAGSRAFAKRHGLSWEDFIRNGIDSEQLEKTGDAMAKRVIEHARESHGRR